jgi:hypothetical protein
MGSRNPLLVRPREEGWLRHQENFGAAHLNAADGVVAPKSHSRMNDHPGRSNKEASRHFLIVASTPPHEASRGGDYARSKSYKAIPQSPGLGSLSATSPTDDGTERSA